MRLQKLSKLLVVTLAVSMIASLALAAGAYKLIYRLQKGQNLKYKMNLSMNTSAEMMGQEMNSSVDGSSSMHIDVEQVSKEGNVTFVQTVDSAWVHIKSAGPQSIDSTFRNPEGVAGKRTRQEITARGKKVKSVDVDSVELAGVAAQMPSQLSSFQLFELPENDVKIGDTWSVSTTDSVSQGGAKFIVTPSRTFTMGAEIDTMGYKCVRLVYKGTTSLKGEGTNGGMKLFFEGEGPNEGVVYFAIKEGVIVTVIDNSDLEMTIALTGQMSMTIPQSTSTKTVVTLVR